MNMNYSLINLAAAGVMLGGSATTTHADETASYSVETEVKFVSDLRNRGVSESGNRPAAQLSVQFAHESGVIALAQLSSNSKKAFLDGEGYGLLLATGYRFGNPDGWHFGVGLATEMFPGAKFDAPHAIDMSAGVATDFRSTRYNTSYAVLEVGWGALEARALNVISKNYRGANTGGTCAPMVALAADPTNGLACYERGADQNSRGSWLFDLDYKIALSDRTAVKLHAGTQRIRNFKEADYSDYSIGLLHKQWGMDWSVEYVVPRTKVRELFQIEDNGKVRSLDNNRLVLAVSKKF